MVRLMMVIFSVAATTLAGAGVTFVLVMGWVSLMPILLAAAIGVLLAVPVSFLVTRAIS